MEARDIVAHAAELYNLGGKKNRMAADRYIEQHVGITNVNDWLVLSQSPLSRSERMVVAVGLGLHPKSDERSLSVLAEMLAAARSEPMTLGYRILNSLRRLMAADIWTSGIASCLPDVQFFAMMGGEDTQVAAKGVERLINKNASRERMETRGKVTSMQRGKQSDMPTRKKRIFIGHGRSDVWRQLKDFLQDRLGLEWDEFSREPAAGYTTIDRLEEMLDNASFAFLVLTAEDEKADDKLHARDNVIHEAGLFQGRLGFKRAIILLEEDCFEFSNIRGLTQIRFPSGDQPFQGSTFIWSSAQEV